MFRILILASPLMALTIGNAIAEDIGKCPNTTELINKPSASNVELAKGIECVAKALDPKSADKMKTDAGHIIQLANKIIGNGSPLAAPDGNNVGVLAADIVKVDPPPKPKPIDPNREQAGNIICQANALRKEDPLADSPLPKDFKCADQKEPAGAIIELANIIIGNG